MTTRRLFRVTFDRHPVRTFYVRAEDMPEAVTIAQAVEIILEGSRAKERAGRDFGEAIIEALTGGVL